MTRFEWNVSDNWSERSSYNKNERNTEVMNTKNSLNSSKLNLLDESDNNNQIKLQSQLDNFRKESHQCMCK